MLGHIYQSCINISNFLWEPIGVLFVAGLIWYTWNNRKDWHNLLAWFVAGGMILAIIWRTHLQITTGRYYGIFIVPALFFSFYLIWRGPWSRHITYILLGVLLIGCFARAPHYNPMEREVLSLYKSVQKDAKQFERVTALSFSQNTVREQFYTGLTVSEVDRQTSLDNILSGLNGNLSIFDGDWDAVYLFLEVRQKQLPEQAELLKLAPAGHLTLIGESWVDRHHKKKTVVLRYLPAGVRDERQCGELLPNGDFREPESEKANVQQQKFLGRRAARFLQENPVFPRRWRILHSLIGKSNSFATVVTRDDGNALRFETDGYLVAVSPEFPVARDQVLNFSVSVEAESFLQISREVTFTRGGGDLYPMFTLRLKPGLRRRFSIHLPARPDCKSGKIWFWLHKGTLEINDVRVQ